MWAKRQIGWHQARGGAEAPDATAHIFECAGLPALSAPPPAAGSVLAGAGSGKESARSRAHWYNHPHTPVGKLAGGPSRPHKANLINRTGGADGFLFATFSFSPDWQAAGPLGYAFLGCTFYVAHWEQIPVLRLRAPLCTRSSMTPYSLIGREAAAARTHDLATSVGLLVFTSNLNGHGRKRS